MAYSADTFTAGEQPTTAKWNKLWSNDASFNDGTGIADDVIKSRHINWAATGGGDNGGIWWEELGRSTLSSSNDTITVSSFSARKHLLVRIVLIATGGTIGAGMTFNGDTGGNYPYRISDNGGADATAGSSTDMRLSASAANNIFIQALINNISAQEKMVMVHTLSANTAGAGNVPGRRELVGKWANTSAQISTLAITNPGTGDFASGSEVVVLGHD